MTRWDLPDEYDLLAALDSDDYTPLQLGPVTAGWVKSQPFSESQPLKTLMGNRVFEVNRETLWYASRDFIMDEAYYTPNGYSSGGMVLNLPDNSLDIKNNAIDYTERSTLALYAALWNCVRLDTNRIHSSLNQQTPDQVVETILRLYNNAYPISALNALSWRGTGLGKLPFSSQMTLLRQSNDGQPLRMVRVKNSLSGFLGFLRLQTMVQNDSTCLLAPENILFVEVDSEEELTLNQSLLNKERLDTFLREIGHQFNPEYDRAFFFGTADDCLSDWVMGKRIPIAKLQEVANRRELL